MRYDAKRVYGFMMAQEDLAIALQNFRRDISHKTEERLRDQIAAYEATVPEEIMRELAVMGRNNLLNDARLRLKQYNTTCFSNK